MIVKLESLLESLVGTTITSVDVGSYEVSLQFSNNVYLMVSKIVFCSKFDPELLKSYEQQVEGDS